MRGWARRCGDAVAEARDGTGRESEIPWARVCSHSRSPSATKGWYLVHLFNAKGKGVYPTLGMGAAKWENSVFRPLPLSGLRRTAAVARDWHWDRLSAGEDLVTTISPDVGRKELGPACEAGTAAGFHYPIGEVPDEDVLERGAVTSGCSWR